MKQSGIWMCDTRVIVEVVPTLQKLTVEDATLLSFCLTVINSERY